MFSCRMRLSGGSWQPSFVYMSTSLAQVNGGPPTYLAGFTNGYFPSLEDWTSSWVSFEVGASALVELEVTKLFGDGVISLAAIHPADRASSSIVHGKAMIQLVGAQQFTVDIDGALDGHDTGMSGVGPFASNRRVVHTFSAFANPVLGVYERPDPTDPNVRTVTPGQMPPTIFSESTLYFLPGTHNITTMPECCVTHDFSAACPCTQSGNTSWPGYVTRFELQSGKTYYIPSDAWLNGAMTSSATSTLYGTRLIGYGHISGHLYRWKLPYNNIGGLNVHMVNDTHIVGPMFVDFPNHNIIVPSGVSGTDPLCDDPACIATKNTLRHIKALGWRTNSDGVHIWGHWNEISDLFLRTNDDSMYIGGEGAPNTWRRVTTWNDANGGPFLFAAAPALIGMQGHQTVMDSHVLYFRKEWPYWCGGVFDLRWTMWVRNVTFINVHISDPFPTCPLLDLRTRRGDDSGVNGGNITNLNLVNVSMAAHSAIRLTPFQCGFEHLRYGLPVSMGCSYPYGMPNQIIGGLTNTTDSIRLSDFQFTNVTVNGTNVAQLLTNPWAFVIVGDVDPIVIDGVPYSNISVSGHRVGDGFMIGEY